MPINNIYRRKRGRRDAPGKKPGGAEEEEEEVEPLFAIKNTQACPRRRSKALFAIEDARGE